MLWNTRAITVTTTATKAVLPMYLSSGTWTRTCWKFARVNGATEKANVSDAGLSAVITSQRNGARKISPTTQAARLRSAENSEERRRAVISVPFMESGALGEREGGDDGHHQDRHQHQREGRGVSEVVVRECLLVDVERHRESGVGGAAAGEHEDQVEGLHAGDARHRAGEQDEEGRRPQHRKRDAGEPPPPARAVDRGRVVEVLGDAAETAEEEQHLVAGLAPDGDSDDGQQRELWVPQPADVSEIHTPEQGGHHTGLVDQHELPDQCHDHETEHVRDEHHRPHESTTSHLSLA